MIARGITVLFAVVVVLAATSPAAFGFELVEVHDAKQYEEFTLGGSAHAALVFFYANWHKHSLEAKKVIVATAEELNRPESTIGGLVMGMVDAGRHPDLARAVGVKGFPSLYLYQFSRKPDVYSYPTYTVKDIITFATHHSSQHRTHLKKLAEARDEKERTHYDFPHPSPGKVVELTAFNFNRVVRDPTKMAMVMYYAKWCDICKATLPMYDQVAAEFVKDDRVVLGRMEVDENKEWLEANGVQIEGVPIFYLYQRGRRDKEKGWEYLGDRDVEGLSIYLNTNNRKTEMDYHELHDQINNYRPDDLPADMLEVELRNRRNKPPAVFDKDGRPFGDMAKSIHAKEDVREGRSRSRAESMVRPSHE